MRRGRGVANQPPRARGRGSGVDGAHDGTLKSTGTAATVGANLATRARTDLEGEEPVQTQHRGSVQSLGILANQQATSMQAIRNRLDLVERALDFVTRHRLAPTSTGLPRDRGAR